MTTSPDPKSEPAPSTTVPAVRPPEPKVPVAFGVMPATFDEALRMAKIIAESDLAGPYKGRIADVYVAMQKGGELGLTPLQALESFYVVNARAVLYGDAPLAVVLRSGLCEDLVEYFEVKGARHDGLVAADWQDDTTAAVCLVKRRGRPQPIASRFTVAQAKTAKLLNKPGPWAQYADRMLKLRARSYALRDGFADVLKGFPIGEELIGMLPEPAPSPLTVDPVRRTDLHDFTDRTSDTRHDPVVVDEITPDPIAD